MINQDQAMADARGAAVATPADRLIERLAELIGAKAIRSVFGEPVQQGGVPAIPVARIRWGFGGGGGRSDARRTAPRPARAAAGVSPRTRSVMSRSAPTGPRLALRPRATRSDEPLP
jgi:uncharacterized spore protein YtfJ